MPHHVIIAVGGTGQVVLHYYTLLYVAGVVREPFDALVMDTDDLNKSLQITQRLLGLLKLRSDANVGLASRRVPTLEYMPLRVKGRATVSEILTGTSETSLGKDHPARAWFGREDLQQEISQGLFARPALSSVLTGKWFSEDLPLQIRGDTNIVVVASLIGGTGGGLITPLVDKLRQLKEKKPGVNLSVRAVFFGEYFDPDRTGISRERHLSNLRMCLGSLQEQGVQDEIKHFALIGDRQEKEFLLKRQDNRERDGTPPWPETDTDPFWCGTQAVAVLLDEKTKEKDVKFGQRGITGKQAAERAHQKPQYKLKDAHEWVLRGTSRAEAIILKSVVDHIAGDPFASTVWSRALVKLIADFWSETTRNLGEDRTQDFPQRLQTEIKGLWEGDNGLSKVFPEEFIKRECSLRSFKRVPWPVVEDFTVDASLLGNVEEAVQRAAATLLFEALRSCDHA